MDKASCYFQYYICDFFAVISYNTEDLTKRLIESSKSSTSSTTVDVKGVITLAVAITSFLLVLTNLEIGSGDNNKNNSTSSNSTIPIASFLVAGIISLALFILIDYHVGFSMFIVFQTIPILVENPKPVGFGGDPISASKVQLPFALVFLVFGPASGLMISKLGSMKPIIIGTLVGAFVLWSLNFTRVILLTCMSPL